MAEALSIPGPSGRDHASLALMSLTVANAQADMKRWERAYQIEVDGKIRRFAVAVEPGAEVGWPNHDDQLVYLALLQLAVRGGQRDVLQCRRQEAFGLMGWGENGRAYRRFTTSLQRLTGLTIYLQSELLARDGRPYSKSNRGTHLIDDFRIDSGRNADVRIEWGGLVREAFALDDLKRLDWDAMMSLPTPLAVQLYRLLDRVKLDGGQVWSSGWRPLADALGMDATAYNRPAKFKAQLEPAIVALVTAGAIDGFDYVRGGHFHFQLRNPFRKRVREVLVAMGVYDAAAVALLVGHDLAVVIAQADCLIHGQRKASQPGGMLVQAVRERYALTYSEDEPVCFAGIWGMLGAGERGEYHAAGLKVCELGDNLLATRSDPAVWPVELRAVVRFLVTHGFEPREV